MKNTVYKALVKDSAGQYVIAYCGDTEQETLCWLSNQPNGGKYRNTLHQFEFEVKPGDFPT